MNDNVKYRLNCTIVGSNSNIGKGGGRHFQPNRHFNTEEEEEGESGRNCQFKN